MPQQIIQILWAVFVFYSCITNYHKFNSLKQYSFFVYFYLTVLRSEIKVDWAVVSAHKAEIKGVDWVCLMWSSGSYRKYSCYWKNSVLCICRTEVPISFLTNGWCPL